MKKGITFYKTDPVYSNNKFLTSALGKEGFFTTDEKKTIGLTGKEVDNNFLVLEGRDIYKFYFDENNNLTIETLNGDKYLVEFNNILQQPDWSCKDIKSISYIKNKPENISDFNNDLGYTKTIFSSSLNQETYKKEELYEIGYITTNNKPKRIYGKVFLWPEIKTVDVEFNERVQTYVFNLKDEMFKKDKLTYFLINQFFVEKEKPVTALLTFNHEIIFSTCSPFGETGVTYDVKIEQINVLLDEDKKNDVYISFSAQNPMILICFCNEEKKYFTLSPLTTYNQTTVEKTGVLIQNETGDENIVICATNLNSKTIKEAYVFNGESVKVLYGEKESVTLECGLSDKKELTECNWDLTDQSGETTTYENVTTIQFMPSSNTTVRCYLKK